MEAIASIAVNSRVPSRDQLREGFDSEPSKSEDLPMNAPKQFLLGGNLVNHRVFGLPVSRGAQSNEAALQSFNAIESSTNSRQCAESTHGVYGTSFTHESIVRNS